MGGGYKIAGGGACEVLHLRKWVGRKKLKRYAEGGGTKSFEVVFMW